MYRKKPEPKPRFNPRLDERGNEILDDTNHIEQLEFRPPTLHEQISRLENAGRIFRSYILEDDDDFGEEFDEVPDEGYTPYELDAMGQDEPTLVKRIQKRLQKKKDDPATPPAATPPSPSPMNAGPSGDGPLEQ